MNTGKTLFAQLMDFLPWTSMYPAMAVSAWLLDMNTVLQISSD